jgi:hypothetical protein
MDIELSEAGRRYAAAYSAHYSGGNLLEALELYSGVVAQHPETTEAVFSRSQLKNIARRVIPEQEILNALVRMARRHLEHDGFTQATPIPSGERTDEER